MASSSWLHEEWTVLQTVAADQLLWQEVQRLSCRRKQKENQEDLLKRVNEETLRQLRHNQDEGNQNGSSGGRQVSEVVAYRSISEMPSIRDLAIQVCVLKVPASHLCAASCHL